VVTLLAGGAIAYLNGGVGADTTIYALAGVGAATLLIFLVNAIAAPMRLDRDQRNEIDDLRQERDKVLADLENAPKPHLRFVSTEVAQAQVVTSRPIGWAASAVGPHPTNDFARVQIANDPPTGLRGERARNVAGYITFSKPDGAVLIDRMLGRWAETPQRIETGRLGLSLEEAQLDIDPNGVPHPLDVSMKRSDDKDCFAFNFENSHAADLRLEKHRLQGNQFQVRIVLRGDNTDEVVGNFVLRNHGVGRGMEFALADDEAMRDLPAPAPRKR
jgi:hypothetical protein